MEQDFYRDRLAAHGLDVLVPDAPGRALVHRVIYEELCLGLVREESRAAYRHVIADLVASGAEGVILGCTEIELLVSEDDSPVPVFPTTRLHAEAAVSAALWAAPTRPSPAATGCASAPPRTGRTRRAPSCPNRSAPQQWSWTPSSGTGKCSTPWN
ncbi:hypothetical protein GCM10020229_56130 [Kitasatospora albolonga]